MAMPIVQKRLIIYWCFFMVSYYGSFNQGISISTNLEVVFQINAKVFDVMVMRRSVCNLVMSSYFFNTCCSVFSLRVLNVQEVVEMSFSLGIDVGDSHLQDVVNYALARYGLAVIVVEQLDSGDPSSSRDGVSYLVYCSTDIGLFVPSCLIAMVSIYIGGNPIYFYYNDNIRFPRTHMFFL